MKILDLFSGVGGLSLGAARAGFDVRLAVELDPRALRAHLANFPATIHSDRDVGTLTGAELLSLANLRRGELDGLIGGPPCQGFSRIGRRRHDDERNSLLIHFFRLVLESRPRFFVAENVLGLLDKRNSALLARALAPVKSKYEVFGPIVATASDFGAPTSRCRVFYVGFRNDVDIHHKCGVDFFLRNKVKSPVVVREALRGLPTWVTVEGPKESIGQVRLHEVKNTPFLEKIASGRPAKVGNEGALELLERRIVTGHVGTVHSEEIEERYGALAPGEADPITKSVRLRADGLCPTLRAGTGPDRGSFQAVRPIHHRRPRVITPREAARLQSFPDWFVFDKTKWHSFRQIGNSVPPLLAEGILKNVKAALK